MNTRTDKPKGARWMESAFSHWFASGFYLRYEFEQAAWQMIQSANKQTQRIIFGATIIELMDSDYAGLTDWQANPMHGRLEPIGRFAITLNDAGKSRLMNFIADRRRIGDSWHDIAEQCEQLRQNNAGEYPKRGSSRAFILETAARLMEQGAAK